MEKKKLDVVLSDVYAVESVIASLGNSLRNVLPRLARSVLGKGSGFPAAQYQSLRFCVMCLECECYLHACSWSSPCRVEGRIVQKGAVLCSQESSMSMSTPMPTPMSIKTQ